MSNTAIYENKNISTKIERKENSKLKLLKNLCSSIKETDARRNLHLKELKKQQKRK